MKNFSIYLLSIVLLGALAMSSCKREGCTNPKAENYDPKAKRDDGSCSIPANGTNSGDGTNPDNEDMAPCEQPGVECLVAEKVVDNTAFAGRTGHGCVTFNGKLYIIGGINTIGSTGYRLNDVWSSSDGENWTLEVSEAPFSKRIHHAVVVHDNKLWVIGGQTDGNTQLNDVWYSADGMNWTEATSNAQFEPLQFHKVISFQNTMYLIGGALLFNDGKVWKSSDGVTWELITESAQIGDRDLHSVDIFDGKIWLFAGREGLSFQNDVWYSEDGVNWTEVVTEEPFTTRAHQSAFALNNKFYVMGGYTNSSYRNDLWVSSNSGVNWSRYIPQDQELLNRRGYIAIPFNNHIYIIGGRVDEEDANDIWRIDPL